MLNRTPEFEEFERREAAQPADYARNMAIFEALYAEAVQLGVLPPKNPFEGIEDKIKLARALNYVPGTPKKNG